MDSSTHMGRNHACYRRQLCWLRFARALYYVDALGGRRRCSQSVWEQTRGSERGDPFSSHTLMFDINSPQFIVAAL